MIWFLVPILGVLISVVVYKSDDYRYLMGGVLLGSVFVALNWDILNAYILIMIIFLPAVIVGFYYKKEASIQKIILYTGITYFISIILFIALNKVLYGNDIIGKYYKVIDILRDYVLKQDLELRANVSNENLLGMTGEQIDSSFNIRKLLIEEIFYLIKYFSISFVCVSSFVYSIVHILFTKLIFVVLKYKTSSIKELFNLSTSPFVSILVILTFLTINSFSDRTPEYIYMTFDNALFIMSLFMFIIGILSNIYIIKESKSSKGFKIFMSIISILWLVISPVVFVIMGVLEGLFNFRRIKKV